MTTSTHVVFLVRHPQTEWNSLSRYQGRIDTELSELGMRQAETIEAMVQPGALDAVFTSPLSRARLLAHRMAERAQVSLILDERLTEIAMGPWEGLLRSQIEDQFGPMLQKWYRRPELVKFPNGESLSDVAHRVDSFLSDRFCDDRVTRIAVVSHDVVVKVAVMLGLGLELTHLHRFRMNNASISVLSGHQLEGSVQTVNSVDHLTKSPFDLPP